MAEAAKMTILNQVQNQVQPTHETARNDAQEEKVENEKTDDNYTEKQGLALACTDLPIQDKVCPVGRGGFEPP